MLLSNKFKEPPTEKPKKTSLYVLTAGKLFEKNQRSTAAPVVYSVITSEICQDCDILAALAALDTKPKLILEHKGKNFIPKVYSEFVFKICGALMIEAQLSPMENNSNWIGKLNRKSKRRTLLLFVPSSSTRSALP
ncbi:hypothetical protein TNCT_104641 [Trichonephila clavata]|uniref:Uncharacterized protein n=1 Tax=Trichonephila clavata TaxID=2740835 RepID=A0A8X6KTU5_TRICU|nr:hypothetical protein TNCT_104641 [Trichonephila clavata]